MLESYLFFVVLLNPFLMTVYLLDLIQKMPGPTFRNVLWRATLISTIVFIVFALSGDLLFREVFHVRLASFQLFGGLVFLIIGVRFVISGPDTIEMLRGGGEHIVGSIAMPFMIGPGTISASILTGAKHQDPIAVVGVIVAAMGSTALTVIALKALHDAIRNRYSSLVQRYIDLTGRASALLIGTIAVEMILTGIEMWSDRAHLPLPPG